LSAFLTPNLEAGEQTRAVLSRTGKPFWAFEVLGQLASLHGVADAFATHRAIAVTDRRVIVVRMPWRRGWSVEHTWDRADVAVSTFSRGSLQAGGFLATPGHLQLHLPGGRRVDFPFGFEGTELASLQVEAEAVVTAIANGPSADGNSG